MTVKHKPFNDGVFTYQTDRLDVLECHADIDKQQHSDFFARIAHILTPSVVQNLPPYFQDINSIEQAELWFDRILSEGQLFAVKSRENSKIIGFLFVHIAFVDPEKGSSAHIGYLLSEPYWGRGLATELLTGFIQLAATHQNWDKLIAGVDVNNLESSKLLVKLGFNPISKQKSTRPKKETKDQVTLYQYPLR